MGWVNSIAEKWFVVSLGDPSLCLHGLNNSKTRDRDREIRTIERSIDLATRNFYY